MTLSFTLSSLFIRHFEQRIAPNEQLVGDYQESVRAFKTDPALVGDHPLGGVMATRRAFWINAAYRVVYRRRGSDILLLDVGTHEQVYRRRRRTSRVAGKELL